MSGAFAYDIRIAVDRRVLVDVRDFRIPSGKITFLFGESGIGKTLLARAVYGLLDTDEFNVTINGKPYGQYLASAGMKRIRENGFFVFQEPSSHLNPLLPLRSQLREGSLSGDAGDLQLLKQLWSGTDENAIESLLKVYPKPFRPSGGEKQRMFLVMALKKMDIAQRASPDGENLFIFDEPTGSLDNRLRDVFLSLLVNRFQRNRFTILFITHDYSIVSEVTRSHKRLIDLIAFKELRLRQGQSEAIDFKPETYLGWLERQRRESKPQRSSPRQRPLLHVQSGAEIFGQRLIISRGGDETETPLQIFPGTMTYLKAPSGTGKTTLVKMMMGLQQSEKLRMMLDGTLLTERTRRRFWQKHIWGRRMTMVFQHADEALNPVSTVAEVFRGLPSRRDTHDTRAILRELFDDELIPAFLDKRVSALSGGQKQRLNLLRSLSLDTEVVILDEPLNGLDFETAAKVLEKLKHMLHENRGILIISHNEEIFDALIPQENVYYLHSQPVRSSR